MMAMSVATVAELVVVFFFFIVVVFVHVELVVIRVIAITARRESDAIMLVGTDPDEATIFGDLASRIDGWEQRMDIIDWRDGLRLWVGKERVLGDVVALYSM